MEVAGDTTAMPMVMVEHEQVLPPPPPPLPARITTCERHPEVVVVGLCALCLRDRLVDLEASRLRKTTDSSSSATAVLRSIFFRQPSSSSNNGNQQQQAQAQQQTQLQQQQQRSSVVPQLRRCKSFSAGRRDGSYATPRASSFEPQRRSCDVRGRSTLWSLFHQDDTQRHRPNVVGGVGELESECRNLGLAPPAPAPVPDPVREEEDEEEFQDAIGAIRLTIQEDVEMDCPPAVSEIVEAVVDKEEKEEDMIVCAEGEEKVPAPVKQVIDQEQQPKQKPPTKDLKEIAGSFWLAASVFSKKLQKWRRKQKLKKEQKQQQQQQRDSSFRRPSFSTSLRRSIDVSEDVLFGPRRSCDVAPRFSLDAGRMSLDDPRCSWEEPRASWDGYLLAGRSVFSRQPPPPLMEESAMSTHSHIVPRSDGLIPVEEDLDIPGGTLQTRDYYGDLPPQRRRRSLDRSGERQQPPSIPICSSNGNGSARVSFELGANDSFHYSSTSLRSDSFDSSYGCGDPPKEPPPPKPRRRWSKPWNIWAFIHRRSSERAGNDVVGRSLSETWPDLRADHSYGNSRRMLRSNSSVSSRSWHNNGIGMGIRGNGNSIGGFHMDLNGGHWHNKKRRDGFVLERNRSARASTGADSSGMLRFYLPPMRSGGRHVAKKPVREGGGFRSHNSFTRSVLQLY